MSNRLMIEPAARVCPDDKPVVVFASVGGHAQATVVVADKAKPAEKGAHRR